MPVKTERRNKTEIPLLPFGEFLIVKKFETTE